jgi:hypothetical protein
MTFSKKGYITTTVMNEEEYRKLIEQADVLDHTTLNVTLKELSFRKEAELVTAIQQTLENNLIPKPDAHPVGTEASAKYYRVTLTYSQVQQILDIFDELEVEHLGPNREPTPTARFYGSLADKWAQVAEANSNL